MEPSVKMLTLFILILPHNSNSEMQIRMKNSTILHHDTYKRITQAIGEEKDNRPASDLSGDHVQAILNKLNKPKGRVGDRCSRIDWERFIKPIIDNIIEGDEVRQAKYYKTFANQAVEDDELVDNVCLSQYYTLECSESGSCVCLKSLDFSKVQSVSCDGSRIWDDFGFTGVIVVVWLISFLYA